MSREVVREKSWSVRLPRVTFLAIQTRQYKIQNIMPKYIGNRFPDLISQHVCFHFFVSLLDSSKSNPLYEMRSVWKGSSHLLLAKKQPTSGNDTLEPRTHIPGPIPIFKMICKVITFVTLSHSLTLLIAWNFFPFKGNFQPWENPIVTGQQIWTGEAEADRHGWSEWVVVI